jgi:tRNA A37 threonylcarbamoyladenosine dehydratase
MVDDDFDADLHSCLIKQKVESEIKQEEQDYMLRFANVGRLYERTGPAVAGTSLQRLQRAHVCIIGLGGVGSWVVESLARSGIGRYQLEIELLYILVCTKLLNFCQ